MMFVANKVCRFGGRPYVKGEVVPDKYIDPRGVRRLLDADILLEMAEGNGEAVTASPAPAEAGTDDVIQETQPEETVSEQEAPAETPDDVDLESLDRNQLYHIAKDKGLDVKPTMSKAKLLEALA